MFPPKISKINKFWNQVISLLDFRNKILFDALPQIRKKRVVVLKNSKGKIFFMQNPKEYQGGVQRSYKFKKLFGYLEST